MAGLHRMYGWRDVAHYVVDEVQPALVSCLESLTKIHERDVRMAKRVDKLTKAQNAVNAELNGRLVDLELRVATLERRP